MFRINTYIPQKKYETLVDIAWLDGQSVDEAEQRYPTDAVREGIVPVTALA
jgi:hypothetical protein